MLHTASIWPTVILTAASSARICIVAADAHLIIVACQRVPTSLYVLLLYIIADVRIQKLATLSRLLSHADVLQVRRRRGDADAIGQHHITDVPKWASCSLSRKALGAACAANGKPACKVGCESFIPDALISCHFHLKYNRGPHVLSICHPPGQPPPPATLSHWAPCFFLDAMLSISQSNTTSTLHVKHVKHGKVMLQQLQRCPPHLCIPPSMR